LPQPAAATAAGLALMLLTSLRLLLSSIATPPAMIVLLLPPALLLLLPCTGGLKLTSFRHLCMSKGRIKMSNSSGRLQAVYKTHYILTPSPGSTLNFLESRVLGRPRNIMGIQVIPDTALKPAGYDGRVVLHVSGRKPELEAASKSTYYKELRDKLVSRQDWLPLLHAVQATCEGVAAAFLAAGSCRKTCLHACAGSSSCMCHLCSSMAVRCV
jgi:hypothetical protein